MEKTKFLISFALIFAVLGILLIFQAQNLGKLRIVFCDVGQGDAILIQLGSKQVVVDGGPGGKILDCLGAKMPFWDRQIEIVVLTHPQKDHMEGLIAVLERYGVKSIVTTGIAAESDVFKAWETAVKAEGAIVHMPNVGDKFLIEKDSALSVLWPPRDKALEWQADPPGDLNETSIVMRLDFGNPSTHSTSSGSSTHSVRSGQLPSEGLEQSCAYLTGDIPKEILQGLIDRQCEILKVSHHGSKTGTNEEILSKANPKVAVIQVGKNSYGHPTKEVLEMLQSKGVKILRNDTDGAIEINLMQQYEE